MTISISWKLGILNKFCSLLTLKFSSQKSPNKLLKILEDSNMLNLQLWEIDPSCHTFSSNLSEIDSIIVENLDTVGSVIRNENFLSIIHNHSIGKLKVLGATKFVQYIAHLKKNKILLY